MFGIGFGKQVWNWAWDWVWDVGLEYGFGIRFWDTGLGLGLGLGLGDRVWGLGFWDIGLGFGWGMWDMGLLLDFIPKYVFCGVHIWTSTGNIRPVGFIYGLSFTEME